MSWLEQILWAPGADDGALAMWLLSGVALVLAAAVLTAIFSGVMVLRYRRLASHLGRLQREMLVYTEASTRVAQTLEAALLGPTTPARTHQTSRRYLLLQARERLHRGESLEGIARGLGLSHDEVRLLEHARIHRPPRSESVARPVSVEFPDSISGMRISAGGGEGTDLCDHRPQAVAPGGA